MKLHISALALMLLSATTGLTNIGLATTGLAQDALPAKAPGSPLIDNEQIRVRELRLAPNATLPNATRPNTFLYALTDGALVFTPPGRKEYELTFKAGEALWLPSQETATANEGDKEVRALLVEIKARAPAAKKSGKKGEKKSGKKSEKKKGSAKE